MPRLSTSVSALTLLASTAAGLAAQAKLPPVRPLGAVENKATELLGAVSTTRALPDGRVLVNDIIGRKVVMFNKTLSSFTVVADTTSATGNAYSSRFAGLLAYKGDSSLFVDPTSLSMLVIDGKGTIGRVMSIPRANDARSLVGGPNGTPGFDAQGRLVYRASPQFRFNAGAPGAQRGDAPRPAGNAMPMPDFPDTVALVRVDLATRKVDTLTWLKIPRTRMTVAQDSAGRMMMSSIIHPLPSVDDWAVLTDGSVAVVRGLDYHIDWIRGDGALAPTGKLPFDWKHLNDSAKVAFMDSTKVAMEKVRAQAIAQRAVGGPGGPGMGPPPGMEGAQVMVFRTERAAADGPRPRNEGAAPAMNFTMPPLQFVAPNELPDYAPPFGPGASRADMDGNLWIRTTNVINGGPVYDVVSAQGELVDRVQLPASRVIAGFGPGGMVYMGVREGAGVRLEQARRAAMALP